MDLRFIPATEADRAFFIYVHHTAYRTVIEKMFGWDEALQDQFANKAFDGGAMRIIWKDQTKIGVVGWHDFPDHFYIEELFLLPDYQGQGTGSAILRHFIQQADSAQKEMRLQTLKENHGAKNLYERHGFIVTDSTETHWKLARPAASSPTDPVAP